MSDTPIDTSVNTRRTPVVAAGPEDLARHLHDVVLAIPGVATLVPTMTTALSRLRRGRLPAKNDDHERRSDLAADGVSVTIDEDAVTAVIDITVAAPDSVLATAQAVHAAAVTTLSSAQATAPIVRVNVLGLEARPDVEH